MIVTIHQPEHLPWLGWFDKVRQADVCVLLDTVQFRKHYVQNRNRIRVHNGMAWITVPVLTTGQTTQAIEAVRIDNRGRPGWRRKTWVTLQQAYQRAPYWPEHAAFLRSVYETEWDRLCEMNVVLIEYLVRAFSIPTRLVRASTLGVTGAQSQRLLDICRRLDADTYLSGVSGRDYLPVDQFVAAGIDVWFQEFHHPIYRQLYEPFYPCLSAIDLLVNHGPRSRAILIGQDVARLAQVFT